MMSHLQTAVVCHNMSGNDTNNINKRKEKNKYLNDEYFDIIDII
jgi:hypothetical protein